MTSEPLTAAFKRALQGAASRRSLLLGASAAGVAALAAAAALSTGRKGVATPVGNIDPEKLVELGDGFYLVDGWVLTADDISSLPGKAD